MLTQRIVAVTFGALTLAASAFAAVPASAAPVAAPVAAAPLQAAPAGDLLQQAQYYRGPRRYYGRPYYRPRCFWSNRRVWNGWRWVVRPVRVCR